MHIKIVKRIVASSLLLVFTISILCPIVQARAQPIIEFSISTPNSMPNGITIFNSLVYFAEYDGNKIGRLDPATGHFDEWTVPTDGSDVSHPTRIITYNGHVYFTDETGNKIGRLDPATGHFDEWDVPTASSSPYEIAVYDGLVYFAEGDGNKIGRLDPTTGHFDEWVVPTAGSIPVGIAIYNGLVYFTENVGNKIGRLDPATGHFDEWDVPTDGSEGSHPTGIFVNDGLVYFTEFYGNNIGRLDPATGHFDEWAVPTGGPWPSEETSGPHGIAIYNGLVYFTEYIGNKIGRLNPANGHFDEWAVPTGVSGSLETTSGPMGIAVYNDCVYFTENYGNKIGILKLVGKTETIELHITSSNVDILLAFPESAYSSGKLLWFYGEQLDATFKQPLYNTLNGLFYTQLANNNGELWGQCVSVCKALSKNDLKTSQWEKGKKRVVDGNVFAGTVIATFSAPGGKYLSIFPGGDHAAIFKAYVIERGKIIGIEVWDQNWYYLDINNNGIWDLDEGVFGTHIIYSKTGKGVSNADNYYVVMIPKI